MDSRHEELREIEGGIRRLKVDFDRYFNGALPIPPEEQRTRLKRLIRDARGLNLRTFAERFYLNTLEARFNTLNELNNRRLRAFEAKGTVAAGAASEPAHDVESGIVLGNKTSLDAVTALYNRLYSSEGRSNKTDFNSFHQYLRKQIDKLRDKTGCDEVRFRVTSANGKPTLKAKPIK